MSIYEGQVPMVPKASGSVSVPYMSSNTDYVEVSVPVTFSVPPFILIKSNDGILPGISTIGGQFIAGSSPKIRFYNGGVPNVTRTIRWWAFAEL
ncbi:hypothetical protein G6M04_16405 [Agrobacterium rhizogenes]|uniref:hypothetical protein n=1 Tax=Rhizobium rhizogenes TaxID=359 RepID=UPI001571852E|nr:hypothetical protein [Rhizobium rhizogenes]NTG48960.1 hypothetical protein [Rhizobium rhizogenes]